jgi:AcrR family transcriptional regulator
MIFVMRTVKPLAEKSKPTRREQAAATRERMIAGAIEVFTEAGYTGARMADIADRAGVAVQTLYFTFHTKPELLSACYEYAVLGPDRLPPNLQPFWTKSLKARSGRAALAAFAEGNTRIIARAAAIDDVAKAAVHEPEVAKIRDQSEALRRSGYRELIAAVAERFGLRRGLDVDRATDLTLTLAGPQTYLSLRESGWTDQEFQDWLSDCLSSQLLQRRGQSSGS